MDIFYNQTGIGDCLIIPISDGNRYEYQYENYGDITRITDLNDSVLGYNIFNASTHLEVQGSGKISLTAEMLSEIKAFFKKNDLDDALDFDLRPKFVVGYVQEKAPHENADKLSVCQVDTGDETLGIVCGAPNVEAGQKVVVAKVGAIMPDGMEIKPTSLRGVPSKGMICSQKELGLQNAAQEKGIYVLEDDYQTGQPFAF